MTQTEEAALEPLPLRERHVVLLVDDEPGVLASLRRSLRGEPYEVLTADSAERALEILGAAPVSLLVTDQRMPGMCGADLFEEVRRRSPGTKRVMLTGYPGSARVSYGLAREIDRLISKPWNDEALRLTLRQMLRERELAPPGPAAAPGGWKGLLRSAVRRVGSARRSRRDGAEGLREMNLILQNAVEGISRHGEDGRFQTVNKTTGDLLGFAPGELLGQDWLGRFAPADRAAVGAATERMRQAGKSEVEARALRKDGTALDVHLVLVRSPGGHFCFMKDLSERKRAERERDEMSAQLFQGQKLQAIGQLAAGIAHEINNPVGFILSNLTTLSEYARDVTRLLRAALALADQATSGRDYLREAEAFARLRKEVDADFIAGDFEAAVVQSREGAERIRDTVKRLKEFTHADRGKFEPVDLRECLEGALRLSWNEIKYKATVERDFAPVPPVPGTPLGLEQVFINLLVNAAQAIEKKGEIRVSLKAEGPDAVVRVRDTGTGVAPEHLKRLFEPFFTTKPVGKGTGLGLHVAYKIVRAHRGTIEVTSEAGRGTEFAVRLPLATDAPGGAP